MEESGCGCFNQGMQGMLSIASSTGFQGRQERCHSFIIVTFEGTLKFNQ
jgi:hypothetical protein